MGTAPDEKHFQRVKDLGFDGIEGNAPGLQVEPIKKACSKLDLPMHGVVYSKHWQIRLSDRNPEVREKVMLEPLLRGRNLNRPTVYSKKQF